MEDSMLQCCKDHVVDGYEKYMTATGVNTQVSVANVKRLTPLFDLGCLQVRQGANRQVVRALVARYYGRRILL